MKTLNIKLSLPLAQRLDDMGRLNPDNISNMIVQALVNFGTHPVNLNKYPIEGLTFAYGLKVDAELHRRLKITAIENELNMNDFVGRLLSVYF